MLPKRLADCRAGLKGARPVSSGLNRLAVGCRICPAGFFLLLMSVLKEFSRLPLFPGWGTAARLALL